MTNLVQSCSKSGLGRTCPCACDRCIITELSKLDLHLLPKLNEPKYRNCEPCRQKYDLILRRGSKQLPLTHDKETPTMVMGEEFVPLADYNSTTHQLSIRKEPVIESPESSSSSSDIDVRTKYEDKGANIAERSVLNPPETTSSSSNTSIGFAADTKGITIPLLPNKVITCDLDTGHIETSDTKVDAVDSLIRKDKLGSNLMEYATKEVPSKSSVKPCNETSSVRPPASGRKLVSIKAKMRGRSPTPANIKPCNSPKRGTNLKNTGRSSPSCSYRVNIRTGKSKVQPTSSGNHNNKDCAVISRSIGGSRSKYTGNKTAPRTLESMPSRSVEAFMTKRNSIPSRHQSGLSVKWHNKRSNSRLSCDGDSRTPWYPLRSTNRWDHYDKLEERPSSPSKTTRTKLVKAKSRVLSKGKTQAITERFVNMEPEHTGTSSVLSRRGKQKSGKPSYLSDATFNPEMRKLRSDSLVYYKLKGKMKPHLITAQDDMPSRIAGHGNDNAKAHQTEPQRHDIYRCSEEVWSDSERTCYVSDGDSCEYVCECICNEELNASQCCSNECQANLASNPTYWREDRYSLGCEECCVESVPTCHGDYTAVKVNTCYGANNTAVTQVIPYDGSSSTNRCSLYKTYPADGSSCGEEEYEAINISEPCYVRGRMTVSRGPGSIPVPHRDRYSYQKCFDSNRPAKHCNCYTEELLSAASYDSLQPYTFRSNQHVATPSASNHCRIRAYG